MVLTVSFVLSPVTGLVCHRRRRNCFRELDASVGAPGPHDFAVRLSAVRYRRISVHRIPPRVRDDRERPSGGRDGGRYRFDLGQARSGIFLQKGLDRKISGLTDLPDRQSRCSPEAISVHRITPRSLGGPRFFHVGRFVI
jgi:hypothetical protein